MDLYQLESYVDQGEGLRLEFKVKLPEPEKLMREAVALANTKGGLLLIGVDDDGEILGVRDSHEVEEAFHKWAMERVVPTLEYTIEKVPLTRKRSVIAIKIPKSKRKPHTVRNPDQDKKGIAYIRVDDKSMRASREMYFVMLRGEDKDVKFEFGEKEHKLMKYLEIHPHITLKEFSKLTGLKPWQSSKTLVLLVRANVLRIQPHEVADRFLLAPTFK